MPAGRLQYGLGLATFPTPCGEAWGHTGNVQGTIVVAWNTKEASRQLVLVVNTYPRVSSKRPFESSTTRRSAPPHDGEIWARLDSNQGPTDYESAALTS